MSEDLFLRIVDREIPADIVYETDNVLAFRDIDPKAPVHILIIPKKKIRTVNDLTAENALVLSEMYLAARELAASENIAEDGYRLVMNCNDHGGQSVYHIHLHLLGGRPMSWPPG
ncbi:MAG: purine nucleoside phosphoramidase [Wenzhouxiangellaceae bacterium]